MAERSGPNRCRRSANPLVNIVHTMREDGDNRGSETPKQPSLDFSLADVSLREEGDAALFAVTKNRPCVYPINSTSGEI